MAIQVTYPLTDSSDYQFDTTQIEISGGEAKLVPQVTPGTAALYAKLDDNAGLIALDSSGNNRHGAFQGGYTENNWTTGKIGSAIKGISAVSGIVNFDRLLEFERTDSFSLECWVKFTTSTTQILISKQENAGNITGFAIVTLAGKIRFTINDSSGNTISVESTSAYNDDVFHHIIVTYDGNSIVAGMNVYVDNVLSQITIVADTLSSTIITTANLQISGRDGNNLCILSTTKIDEVVMYERELTSADVTFRWNMGYGTQELSGGSTIFPVDNPVIYPIAKFLIDSLDSWSSVETETGDDSITFNLKLNSQSTYWNGSEWVDSDDTLAQTNTSSEINTNIGDLVLSENTTFIPQAFLHSDDGSTTPSLSSISIIFTQAASSEIEPTTCKIINTIFDNQGNPVEDVTVTAVLITLGEYGINATITKNVASVVSDEDGYWELNLIENENMQERAGYRFKFSGENTNVSYDKIVPDGIEKNFWELENLIY